MIFRMSCYRGQEVDMGIIGHDELKPEKMTMDGVAGTSMAKIIGPPQGWPDHTLRLVRMSPRGHTPHHQHDWEHVNYFIGGRGMLTIDGVTREVSPGDFAFVPANAKHQFQNPFSEDFEFICIVPNRGA